MATRLFPLLAIALGADYLSGRRGLSQCLTSGDDYDYHQYYTLKAREEVRDEIKWVWSRYREKALGADSILPEEGFPYDDWGGLNLFLVEGLDTLKLVGLDGWFEEGVKFINKKAYYRRNLNINVMETTIRVLGSLLSAYELSPSPSLLRRCTELGDRLALSFKMRGVLPFSDLNLETGEAQLLRNLTSLSEMGSLSLEFRKLSELSGNSTYSSLVETVESFLLVKWWQGGGLLRYYYDPYKNEFVGRKCVGASEDSFYEYVYKVWLYTGRKKEKYWKVYQMSKQAIIQTLVEKTYFGDVYLKEIQDNGEDANILEHLACFYPGLLALENILDGYNHTEATIAEAITRTCVSLYERSLKHLSPDLVAYPNNYNLYMPKDYTSFHLRPETIESLFYLYRLTKDQYYRDAAYSIFAAIRKHAKAEWGYSSVKDVNGEEDGKLNEQPSYFVAETMKYLFLMFEEVRG